MDSHKLEIKTLKLNETQTVVICIKHELMYVRAIPATPSLKVMTPEREEAKITKAMAFKTVQLFKTEMLGTGSYGAVCKAKCDQLVCAAKLLYSVLFKIQVDSSKTNKHRQPMQRFEQECHFLSLINHPNIVQYLGTYRDPETNAPVLLMELMDESLTHFLNLSAEDVPYHIQVNLSYDIAQALAFLHANGIIHRDLSSNNVLLLAGRAKVADFGMSKFDVHLKTMTGCPGTPAFMPPEALSSPPVYTEKLDIFSLGVLMIQIMTREFPQPSHPLVTIEVTDPSHPERKVKAQLPVPEAERRHPQVSLIKQSHPLLPIAQTCLRDNDSARPSSEELCGIFSCVKESVKYKTSSSSFKIDFVHTLNEKELQLEAYKSEIMQLKKNIEKKKTELREMEEKWKDTDEMLKEAEEKADILTKHLRAQSQTHQWREKQSLSHGNEFQNGPMDKFPQRTRHRSPAPEQKGIEWRPPKEQKGMEWRPLKDCPINLQAGSSAVIDKRAYFQNKDSGAIMEYDSISGYWTLLPFHPLRQCGLTCFENQLTTVGGHNDQFLASNKLYCLVDRQWTDPLPPMPTRRDSPAVTATSSSLIVAGGRNRYQAPLKVIEVLGVTTKQWSEAVALPFPTYHSSAVLHKGRLYVTTGEGGYSHSRRSVTTCSLETLLEKRQTTPYTSQQTAWQPIADLPTQDVTLAEVKGRLFAMGGTHPPKKSASNEQHRGTKVVYEYNSSENTWSYAGHMTISRYHCLVGVFPGNRLMVVGGVSAKEENSKSVEYTTIRD